MTQYEVFLDDPANGSSSYFLGALGFTGTIGQNNAFFGGLVVNDEVLAAAQNGNFGYVESTDSYFYTPFTANTVAPGITDTALATLGFAPRTYAITAGSGGGSKLDYTQIAQIVASGDVAVAGTVARLGIVVPHSGTMSAIIPEPSTFVLLGLGMVGLVGFARRQRKSA